MDFGESFAFLGRGVNGSYSFYVMGQFAEPLPNEFVDEALNNEYKLDELEEIVGDNIRWIGTNIGIFHLPRHTFVFTGDWSQWYSGVDLNADEIWRIRDIQFAYGYLWTGDETANTIGVLNNSAQEYENDIEGQILTFVRSEPRANFIINKIFLLCTTGLSGVENKISLAVNDDARLFGPEEWVSLGKQGQYNQEVSWGSPVIKADNYVGIKLRWIGKFIVNSEGLSFE